MQNMIGVFGALRDMKPSFDFYGNLGIHFQVYVHHAVRLSQYRSDGKSALFAEHKSTEVRMSKRRNYRAQDRSRFQMEYEALELAINQHMIG